MSDIVPQASFEQREGEPNHHYAWFMRWLEQGESRDVKRVARQCGVPLDQVRAAHAAGKWDERAPGYDLARAEVARSLMSGADEELAMQAQYAAGMIMMQLGVRKLEELNTTRLTAKQAIELVAKGGELVGRGTGQANVHVTFDAKENVKGILDILAGDDQD